MSDIDLGAWLRWTLRFSDPKEQRDDKETSEKALFFALFLFIEIAKGRNALASPICR